MRLKLITVYLLIVSALALVGYISFTGLNNLMITLREAIQPDERKERFDQILDYITEAENNIRMLTITQDRRYERPYNESIDELENHIQQLYKENAGDSTLLVYLDRIFDLIQQKIYVQEDLILLKRKNIRPDIYGEVLAEITSLESQINQPDTFVSIEKRPVIIDSSTRKEIPPLIEEENLIQKRGFFARLFGTTKKEDIPLEMSEEPIFEDNEAFVAENEIDTDINDTITTIVDNPVEISKPILETIDNIKRRDNYIQKLLTQSELRLTKKDDALTMQVTEVIDTVNSYIQVKSIQKAGEATTLFKQTTKYITMVGSGAAMLFLILIFIVMKDFQVILKTKKELENAKNKAENLAQVKEEFLASMSHEIRTPLNAIIGFSNYIRESSLSGSDKNYLEIIKNSSRHLLDIINDILDFSKLDSSQMKLEKTPFDFSKLLEETVDSFHSDINLKGLKMELNIDPDLSNKQIIGDPYRFRQILNNLISNAIKFTSKGFIKVQASLNKNTHLIIDIIDSGIGIPSEKLKIIFEKFAQADTSTTRRFGGTGLGLTIVKNLIGLMKGHILVKSKVNHGTSFTLTIPISIQKSSPSKESTREITYHDLSEITCLIADDDNYNLLLLEKTLKDYYIKVFSVTSGIEALDYVDQIRFDIVLLDLQMPEMDGYTVASKLREKNYKNPILALSAYVDEDVLEKCKDMGIDQVIRKPFEEQALIKIIIDKTKTHKKSFVYGLKSKVNINLKQLKLNKEDHSEFKDKMIIIYLKNLEEFLSVVNSSSEDQNFENIQYAAHKLIPSTRHMGITELVNLLKKVEEFSLSKQNKKEAEALVERIILIIKQVKDQVQSQLSKVTIAK